MDLAQDFIGDLQGAEMHRFIKKLFPICRSITGNGVRETLAVVQRHLPDLELHEVPTGTQVFDWTVPEEWNIRGARLTGPDGEAVVDFADHNLHVVGYSEPVDRELSLDELEPHLYSLPEMPEAIPYITSYYQRRWGFCLPHRKRESLKPGRYHARIDSELAPGSLTYGEVILPGESEREIFVSTYVCHPSMANNELSGPAVTTWLAKWLMQKARRFTYRIIFIPETIGSITYLSRNLERMKEMTVAGFNISCVGDDRCYSYLPSRHGDTLSDRAARHVLARHSPDYVRYTYLDRGSDERQYCAPGVDLPVCSVLRSKFGRFPEYHTSLDNLDLVTPSGLSGSLNLLQKCISLIERNYVYKATVLCEPQLGKRGLYPTLSTGYIGRESKALKNFIAYADGTRDLIEIAEAIDEDALACADIAEMLKSHRLLTREDPHVRGGGWQ